MTVAVQVHKYGGSSMANADMISNVARRVAKVKESGIGVVAVVSAMGNATDELIRLAQAVAHELDPRDLDLLLSTGEVVSCTLLSLAVRNLGYDAISLTGSQAGIHTDAKYGRARIIRIDTERIQRELASGRVVIVAGFQGRSQELEVTTLGRGGSDTTAVALAAALGAERCEIYTDVSGIFTADPQIVRDARKMDEIGYQEMLELANYGAKMEPRSIELGAAYQIPIYVGSSFDNGPGTLIHQEPDGWNMEDKVKVTGIAYNTNVAKITVRSLPDRPGIAAAIFEPLVEAGISVDTIVQNTSVERLTDISFTVSRPDLPRALLEMGGILEVIGGTDLVSDDTLASVTVVGSGMQHSPGYASRLFRILADGKINIDMITTSEIRISCIVLEAQVHEAVRLLHLGFRLDQ
jgi:aspartate kinase